MSEEISTVRLDPNWPGLLVLKNQTSFDPEALRDVANLLEKVRDDVVKARRDGGLDDLQDNAWLDFSNPGFGRTNSVAVSNTLTYYQEVHTRLSTEYANLLNALAAVVAGLRQTAQTLQDSDDMSAASASAAGRKVGTTAPLPTDTTSPVNADGTFE